MRNLGSGGKAKVCPGSHDHIFMINSLPEEMSEVAASLLPEDLEILAYLISCPEIRSSSHHSVKPGKKAGEVVSQSKRGGEFKQSSGEDFSKPALFCCNCFQCYTSYWSRWDTSPNRGKIDEAIALYEEYNDRRMKQTSAKGLKESKVEKKHHAKKSRKPHKESNDEQQARSMVAQLEVAGSHGKNGQGSKERTSKETRPTKTSRVAAIGGEDMVEACDSDTCAFDSLEMDSESLDDATMLFRGSRLMRFIVGLLWGARDRQVRTLDVY